MSAPLFSPSPLAERRSSRWYQFGLRFSIVLAGVLIAAFTVEAQPSEDLEARVTAASGPERISQIVELLEEINYRDPQQALLAVQFGQEAMAYLAEEPDESLELEITCCLCRAQMETGDFEIARSTGEDCAEQAEAQKNISWQAWAQLWCLGEALARNNQLGLGIVHQMRAVELYETLGDPLQLAGSLTQAGMHLESIGDYSASMEYHLRSQQIFESLGDQRGQAITALRLGAVFEALGEPQKSLENAQKAYENFLATGSENGEAAALLNLGVSYAQLDQTEKAVEYLQRALELRRRQGNTRSIGLALLNLSAIHLQQGRLEEAKNLALEARETFRSFNGMLVFALAGIELAKAQKALGNLESASTTIRESVALAEEFQFEERALEAYSLLAEIQEEQGDLDEALATLRQYDELRMEFWTANKARQMVEMEARYEAEGRAQEIERLKEQQARQTLEMQNQRAFRTGLVIAFVLLLLVLALLFNRYRLRAHARHMAEVIENEKAVSASLREVDRLKDDFLANTSHELRTPLYGMVGLAESLLDGSSGKLPQAAQRDLKLILTSGTRLTTLVGDILDSAKLRRQDLELTQAPVDLHALADIVLTLSRPLVEDKEVELVNAVPTNLPPALADTNRVQQVLHNLLGNAIKFTEHGTITLEASLEGGELEMRVRDTGIGIAPELQDKIFHSFEQADASIERLYGGTGLGLTISRQLVRLHGGELRVESTPGEGSTFFFALPVASEAEETLLAARAHPALLTLSPSEEISAPSTATDPPPEDVITLLVIDDEPINRQVLTNHLTALDYQVLVAADGAEAIEILSSQTQTIDLVLLDIMMPRMSGYEVCRWIRERHSRESLPVIFLSAKSQSSDRIAAFQEGGNDYLAKPIAKQELLQRVTTQLELLDAHRKQAVELKVLRGLLTICAECKKIRNQDDQWDALESYIDQHSEATFSHGLCPTCVDAVFWGQESG